METNHGNREKFNFSGELINSDFEIIELDSDPAGFRRVSLVLGNGESGRGVINALTRGHIFIDKLKGVNVKIEHDIRDAKPTEMIDKYGCKMHVSNISGHPDQVFTFYVDEDINKLKELLGV